MSRGLPGNVKNGSSRVSPRGPVFLSYRHSDGAELAVALAWALRSAGVPVWLDRSDLPPGDTERRLEEAMQSGLSGAVLLVTPDIGASSVIKNIELPHLLALEAQGAFTTVDCIDHRGRSWGLGLFRARPPSVSDCANPKGTAPGPGLDFEGHRGHSAQSLPSKGWRRSGRISSRPDKSSTSICKLASFRRPLARTET